MLVNLLLYLAAGAVAGLISGLFGLGGGVVVVPVLLAVFALQGYAESVIVHMAVATSLATIVVTSLGAVRAHYQLDGILWPTFLRLGTGTAVGAVAGAFVAGALSGELLRGIFAVFLMVVAAYMALGRPPRPGARLPGGLGLGGVGLGIGGVSALVGIGGGTMTVPFLAWCGVAMRRAVGTSAACGLPIALAGAAGFMVAGHGHPDLPGWTTGYVYWPAFAGIVAMSLVLSPLGARLAHRLPAVQLQRGFAVLLGLIGLRLLFW